MNLSMSSSTSKIEAIQREIVEIHGYNTRQPEASTSIDRHNNKSIDRHNKKSIDSHKMTSIDDATN